MKGNVVDMAVGVIIGAASADRLCAVANVIMPPRHGVVWREFHRSRPPDRHGAGRPPVVLQSAPSATLFDFVIIAFAAVPCDQGHQQAQKPVVPAAPPTPREEVLLEKSAIC